MRPGRNDPCTCGSGRKYKNCCLRVEATAQPHASSSRSRAAAGLTPGVREAAARERIWQAEALPLLIHFEEPASSRPVAVLIVAGELVLHCDMHSRVAAGPEPVATTLERAIVAAATEIGNYPEDVHVRHADVAAVLAPLLEARQVEVRCVDPLPDLEDAARSLMDTVAGACIWPPACRCDNWSAWDLPRPLVGQLFAAAAGYFRSAPWRGLANLQAPRARLPSRREWTVCVLGNAGQQFGIALYSSAEDVFEHVPAAPDDDPFAGIRGRIITVSFERVSDTSAAAVREARLARWEIAAPAAFPMLMTVNTPGGGIEADDIRDLVLLMRAIPPFVVTHEPALQRELRTGKACQPIDWLHEETGVWLHYAGEGALIDDGQDGADDGPAAGFGLQFDELMNEVLAELGPGAEPDAILHELNIRLGHRAAALNRTPQPELGGLSPEQVQRLLHRDWSDPAAAIALTRDLSLDELAGSDLLFNARVLLEHAAETGALGATQTGNLQVAVVRALLDRLRIDPDHYIHRRALARIVEKDVWELHELRVLATLAGLLRRRKNRFELTRLGRDLLAAPRAGELFARLFETCFRRFNLAYGTRLDWPELQYQAAFTLYRLSLLDHEWRPPDQLLHGYVLPHAIERAPDMELYDLAPTALANLMLDPLHAFGLLERRRAKPRPNRDYLYRPAPLLAKFLRFSL